MAGILGSLGMMAAGSLIKNGISSIFGLGSGAIGYKQGKEMMKKQHEYDLEKMGIQHGYNIESQKLGLYRDWETDRKSTRLNSSHSAKSRMPSSA